MRRNLKAGKARKKDIVSLVGCIRELTESSPIRAGRVWNIIQPICGMDEETEEPMVEIMWSRHPAPAWDPWVAEASTILLYQSRTFNLERLNAKMR